MKKVLVLGAGQSAPYLIQHLLTRAEKHDWFVTVGDRDLQLAQKRIANHPRGSAIQFDVNDAGLRDAEFSKATVIVNLLPPTLQPLIAWTCVQQKRHMVSASYRDDNIRSLDADAKRNGVLILTEVGLDPGFDLMSAMSLIHRIRENGGRIESLESYGSGVLAPEASVNPLRYCITWNARNVVMSAEHGAQYRKDGCIKIVPWHHVFQHSWPFDVDGIGPMEAYPNRDSLSYEQIFGLKYAHTMIRGTLRYPGWSETWHQIVRLGLPNEHLRIPNLHDRSYAEIVEMFLPPGINGTSLEQRTASFLNVSPTGRIMDNLRWLGLFSDEQIGIEGETGADAMIHLLRTKLRLPDDVPDAVIIVHRFEVCYPDDNGRKEVITSTFTHRGEPGVTTAMAKAVGLPAGAATEMILTGRIPLTGCHMPTHEMIYAPILEALRGYGLEFKETYESV
jgi:saccharopine dehydrogenase (NADP+, L-glutamate forming)